ncbi:armadillo-type protein [Lactarius hatsudake]|nr:armadillo-type protein [Lactarius hatsudake]
MDTLFGRKKSRQRQSSISGQDLRSVPYDRVLPGPPIAVARPTAAASISAPTTNPTLTTNGTDLNLRTLQRTRAERERAYAAANAPLPRSGSPSSSLVTDESSVRHSESPDFVSVPPTPSTPRKLRQSGSSSGRRSPSNHDSIQSLPPIPPTPLSPPTSSAASATSVTLRPMSSSSTRSDNRSSRYTFQSESHSSHSHHHFPHFHRHGTMDDFNFPRPDNDAEIEALFENIVRTRDLGKLPPLSIDQKWNMVESDERIRWRDEKKAKKVPEQSRPGGFEEGSPEWYLSKFLENSITPKGASGLLVSLRGHEVWWFRQFVAMQGTRVLALTLSRISGKGMQRTEVDHQLEYEVIRCIKQILNSQHATNEALGHNLLVTQIASSLNSPRLAVRKLVVELLTFLTYRNTEALNLVTGALETVSITNNTGNSPYGYWFANFEKSISGRGKMGSLVGASEEVRRNAATESNINEYALSNLLLINGILENTDDLDLRIHHHSQMATAGLRRIVELCRGFNFEQLNTQLNTLQETIDNDEKELRERLDQEGDVYAALKSRTDNSRAHDHLLSILQHLLIIREDGPGMVQYYQLLDSLVTDVVMDHKLSGAEQRLGKSVEGIISQFNDADQHRVVEAEAAKMRADLRRLELEKEALESEVMSGGDGLVGVLKGKIASLEEKLQISRETTARLQTQLETQKSNYEEQITQARSPDHGAFPDAQGTRHRWSE